MKVSEPKKPVVVLSKAEMQALDALLQDAVKNGGTPATVSVLLKLMDHVEQEKTEPKPDMGPFKDCGRGRLGETGGKPDFCPAVVL